MAKPEDNYNPVPTVSPQVGSPNDTLSVRAGPGSFGGQVGGALQNAGQALQQVGNQATDIAIQRQGMLNETLATNAESTYSQAVGSVYGDYKSKKGLDAVAARDPAITSILGIRQKVRDTLPNPAAQRAFDLLAIRRESYMLQDINAYAGGQIKEADTTSAMAAQRIAIESASRPEIAGSRALFDEALGNIQFQSVRVVSNQGYGSVMHQDPRTGSITFDDTDDGKKAKAVYDDFVNKANGEAWERREDVVAFDPQKGNVGVAVKELEDNRERIPAAAYARISAKLAGPYKAMQTRDIANTVLAGADNQYTSDISGIPGGNPSYTPESISSNPTSAFGLILGSPVTITSGQRTPEQNRIAKGAPTSEHLTGNAWDFKPTGLNTRDAAITMAQRLQGFDQIIDEGDHVHVGFGPKNRGEVLQKVGSKYVKLDTAKGGSGYQSKADWYDVHYGELITKARQEAEARFPDNPALADAAVSNTETKINDIIRTQRVSLRADQDALLLAVQGKYTNGQPLTTADQLDTIPDIADTWHRYQMDNPLGAQNLVTKIIPSYSRGVASTYGSNFYKYYSDVISGKIIDPGHLADGIDPKVPAKDSPLTNTGFNALKNILQEVNTPEGKAFQQDVFNHLNSSAVRGAITGTGSAPGRYTPKLDAKYETFLQDVLPKIQSAHARGVTTDKMFDPKSSEYVLGSLDRYKYTQAQFFIDSGKVFMSPTGLNPTVPFDVKTIKSQDDLFKALKDNKINKNQFADLAVKLGLARAAPPPVPTPH